MTKLAGDAMMNAVSALYGTIDGSTEWSDAVSQLLRSTRSAHFTFLSFGRDGSVRQDSWPRVPECTMEYASDYADKDLRVARVLNGQRGVMTTQDIMEPEEIARCPIHQEHYRRFPDAWNSLFATVEAEQRLMVPLLQRSAVRTEYSDEEKAQLRVLSPHIARAYHLREILPIDDIPQHGIVAAFDSLDDGIIILDQDGVAVHLNAAAERMIAARDALSLRHGVLSATHVQSQDTFYRFLAQTLRVLAGESLHLPGPVAVKREGKRFPLILQPFVTPNGNGEIARAVLKMRDASSFRVPSIETIRSAIDLTDAEARLAAALLRGDAVSEYARASGVSEHTVRTHLRNMRGKLGVGRYSDIVILLMRLAQI